MRYAGLVAWFRSRRESTRPPPLGAAAWTSISAKLLSHAADSDALPSPPRRGAVGRRPGRGDTPTARSRARPGADVRGRPPWEHPAPGRLRPGEPRMEGTRNDSHEIRSRERQQDVRRRRRADPNRGRAAGPRRSDREVLREYSRIMDRYAPAAFNYDELRSAG